MKKLSIFLFLLAAILNQSFAQESSEKPFYNYDETQHEFSLDILPIINGHYPASLLYRKHYKTKNDKDAALRFGLNFTNNYHVAKSDFTPINSTSQHNNNVGFSIGKEWHRNFTPRNMGYYGVDLHFGYSEFKINRDPDSFPNEKRSTFSYSSIGFIGMKHHFSKNFSVSAESGISAMFSHSNNINNDGNLGEEKTSIQHFTLVLLPINALRFAFHF